MYVQMCIQWSCELSPASCEWDPVKARENFAKHAVRFGEATAVLEDDLALTMRDSFSEDEERWITLGRNEAGRILVISARLGVGPSFPCRRERRGLRFGLMTRFLPGSGSRWNERAGGVTRR
jgi:hypothetical protein